MICIFLYQLLLCEESAKDWWREILCLENEKMLCHVKMNVIRLDPAELRAVNPIDRYQSFTRNKRVAEILGNSTTSSYFNSYLIL